MILVNHLYTFRLLYIIHPSQSKVNFVPHLHRTLHKAVDTPPTYTTCDMCQSSAWKDLTFLLFTYQSFVTSNALHVITQHLQLFYSIFDICHLQCFTVNVTVTPGTFNKCNYCIKLLNHWWQICKTFYKVISFHSWIETFYSVYSV